MPGFVFAAVDSSLPMLLCDWWEGFDGPKQMGRNIGIAEANATGQEPSVGAVNQKGPRGI